MPRPGPDRHTEIILPLIAEHVRSLVQRGCTDISIGGVLETLRNTGKIKVSNTKRTRIADDFRKTYPSLAIHVSAPSHRGRHASIAQELAAAEATIKAQAERIAELEDLNVRLENQREQLRHIACKLHRASCEYIG